jgi:hypothetical protein
VYYDLREAVTTLEDTTRIARRVLGGTHPLTTAIEHDLPNARESLHVLGRVLNEGVTLDDLREAVTTLGESERNARRVLGGAHPVTVDIEGRLRNARAVLRDRDRSP